MYKRQLYAQGDTARGALHQQTFYGAIERQGEVRYVVRKPLGQLQPSDVDKIVDDAVRQKVKEAIKAVGFKTAMDTESHPIWMNEQKRVPIRKVRIFAGKNISPKPLGGKKHRDLSALPHKRPVYVSYGSNYCMAVYEGKDNQGELKQMCIRDSGMPGHSFPHCAVRRRLSDENMRPVYALSLIHIR